MSVASILCGVRLKVILLSNSANWTPAFHTYLVSSNRNVVFFICDTDEWTKDGWIKNDESFKNFLVFEGEYHARHQYIIRKFLMFI